MCEKLRSIVTVVLMLCLLTTLAACGSANNPSQPISLSASDASTKQDESKTNSSAETDILGNVSPCGVHNDHPFYIGYLEDFGETLNNYVVVDFTEDVSHTDDAKQIAVYIPGSSTRVAIVNIAFDRSSDGFYPLNNVGWTKLSADQYMLFPATLPDDVADIAVVVYSDDWETQQAFALTHSGTIGLVLTPITLDE